MEKRRYLSKSSINTYINCPRCWKYKYIERKKEPPRDDTQVGLLVHDVCNKFYDHIDLNNATYEHFRDVLIKLEPNAECRSFLENFADFEKRRYDMCIEKGKDLNEYFVPTMREEKLESHEKELMGYVDRIDKLTTNTWAVIDIKTGKFNTNRISSMRRELCIYAMLAKDDPKVGFPVDFIGGYFPRTNDLFVERIKSVSMTAALRAIDKVRKGIADKDFPAKPSMLCSWCGFASFCNEAKKW